MTAQTWVSLKFERFSIVVFVVRKQWFVYHCDNLHSILSFGMNSLSFRSPTGLLVFHVDGISVEVACLWHLPKLVHFGELIGISQMKKLGIVDYHEIQACT